MFENLTNVLKFGCFIRICKVFKHFNTFYPIECGRSFKEKQILKNHERVHLPDEQKLKYPCSYCDKKFVNNHCLKIHIARIHERGRSLNPFIHIIPLIIKNPV